MPTIHVCKAPAKGAQTPHLRIVYKLGFLSMPSAAAACFEKLENGINRHEETGLHAGEFDEPVFHVEPSCLIVLGIGNYSKNCKIGA